MLSALAPILLALPPAAPGGDAWRFGQFLVEARGLAEPAAVCVDTQGRVLIAERFSGNVLWSEPGEGPLQFRHGSGGWWGGARELRGVAVTAAGVVLASDTLQHAVLVFAEDPVANAPHRTIGRRGAGPGELREPRGIAVHDGRVYVADSGNHRISVFALDGTFERAIGRKGHGDGELLAPSDVDVDAAGDVFVADLGNQRVVRFAPDGSFVRAWGGLGPYAGLFHAPTGLACWNGVVLVADRDNHRVQVFDPDGKRLHDWGVHAILPREGAGKLHYPCDVAVAPDGAFAAVVEGLEDRVQLFRAQEDLEAAPAPTERTTAAHYEGGCDALGDLLATLEPSGPTVSLFDLSKGPPIEYTRFGTFGPQPGRLLAPAGVVFSAGGDSVWVSDPLAGRISEFRVAREPGAPLRFEPFLARFVRALDLAALPGVPEAPWPAEPAALARAADGTLYVADRANARVIVLDPELHFARTFGRWGRGDDELLDVSAIAVAPDGARVWVADPRGRAIHVFARDGRHLARWTLPHPVGDDVGWRPAGLAPAEDGGVWCSAEDGHALLRLDAAGKVAATVGTPGTSGLKRLEFFKPEGLARGGNGRLFAIDAGNHRFQVLDAQGRFLDAWGARLFLEPTFEPK